MECCSVCRCDFSLEDEGGIAGEFGILPVQFCPTCLSSMFDMVDQLGDDMTMEWGNSKVATKYMYQRIYDILDYSDDVFTDLSRLLDELAHNYEVDTGKKIGASNEDI